MRYLNEYRDGRVAGKIIKEICRTITQPWIIMEVCGGQTHSILKHGLDEMLPKGIELVHGPGCPVCVTPLEMIDQAHAIAMCPDVIFTSFGDMLRVPGSHDDLLRLKSRGADVRVVYSPLDCLQIAKSNPGKQVVFFGIGFETTAPANAMAIYRAKVEGLDNFSILVSQVTVPPIIASVLQAPDNRVQAFLGPGHVCTIMGVREYEPISTHYRAPIVVTGFEPLDILEGVLMAVRQLESGRAEVENQYGRAVTQDGNREAQRIINEVFDIRDFKWRGLGTIPKSGYKLSFEFQRYDAATRFEVEHIDTAEPEICISGLVLKGLKKPYECPAFGNECTPQNPLGATMVSAEGACAAYFTYGRHRVAV